MSLSNVQLIFSVATRCTLANCVAGFDKAYSVSTKRTVSISYPFIFLLLGFWSFGGCDTLSLLSFTISDEGYLSLYTDLTLAFLPQIALTLEICKEHDDFLSNWDVSALFREAVVPPSNLLSFRSVCDKNKKEMSQDNFGEKIPFWLYAL